MEDPSRAKHLTLRVLARRANESEDIAEPHLTKLRIEIEEDKHIESTADTLHTEPTRQQPIKLMPDDNLIIHLTDIVEPREQRSKMDILNPAFVKHRADIDEPMCASSAEEKLPPLVIPNFVLFVPLIETLDPMRAK
jgi:hypothetical protein